MDLKVYTTDVTLAGSYDIFARFKQYGGSSNVENVDYADIAFTLNLQTCLSTWSFPTPTASDMDGSVFRVLEGTSLSIEWPIVDSVYRNC